MSRILIEHVDVITLDDQDRVLHDAFVAIDGHSISFVSDQAPEGFEPDERIDGRDRVVLPGMYNAHCHSPMTLERGWAEDLPFDRWLNERIWVAESTLQEEDVYWGASLAACEMIRCGIIGFADHYFWMDQVARAVEESGMKALLAWCYFGLGKDREVGGIGLERTVEFCERWQGASNGRIQTALGPHSPYMCPPQELERIALQARQLESRIHLHLAESEQQVERSIEQHGLSPVAHVASLGVLENPTIAAHCIAVDDQDLRILADHGVSVAHTPKTYMKLAMGMTPLKRMQDANVDVALGTDGPASNSDLNLLEVLRLVGLWNKQHHQDAEAFPITQLLRMACRSGARAMGFDGGIIEAGAPADLILLDQRGPHWIPRHDIAATVVYGSHPSDVSHVMVNGNLLLREGELLTLDEKRIAREAEQRAMRMVGSSMSPLRTYRG